MTANVDGLAMPDIEPMKASDKAMAGSDQPDVMRALRKFGFFKRGWLLN